MRIALVRTTLTIVSSVEAFHDVHRDLERVRPRRVAVRVVGLERDVVDADALERLQAVRVVEEAAVDALVVVLRRRSLHLVPDATPGDVVLPDRVGALEDVRDPADLALGVRELQRRELLEDPGHQVVGHRHRGVHVREGRTDRGRRVGRRRRHLRARADVHADDALGLRARLEERVPVAVLVVHRRQAEERRDLGEAHRVPTTRRVAPHLFGREVRVPELDDRERDEPAVGAGAPLVEHPVVVGLHAEVRELLVLALEERLAAEPGEGRERQRHLGVVRVHVLEASLLVPAALAHVVHRDRGDGDLVARVARGGHEPDERVLQVLGEPPVAPGAVFALVGLAVAEHATDEASSRRPSGGRAAGRPP